MFELVLRIVCWFGGTVLVSIATLKFATALISRLWNYLDFVRAFRNIPTHKMRPVLSYWEWLRRANRQKCLRTFVLQILHAVFVLYAPTNKIFLIWIGSRPIIFFLKPEIVEVLLNNSKTISKSVEYGLLMPWLGTGLLTSGGDKWRTRRKILTPTFHFQILENFMATFNEESNVLTKKLELEVGKPWIDIVPSMTMCTLDIICQTAMGVQLNVQSGCCRDYMHRIEKLTDAMFYRAFRPWFWPDIIFNYCSPVGWEFCKNVQAIHDFTRKVIREKKESLIRERKESLITENCIREVTSQIPKKKAFLELLLELHLKDNSFTEEDIREEVDTFMFEGHDTTAMAMSWALYELGQHPGIQEKVYQELESIFGSDKERNITSEDLKQMKYLECIIKETLRLYPSVNFILRKLTENLKIDDYTLPAGCSCCVLILMLHQDPDHFPRPQVFDPDRFSPENSCQRHPYAYIPFSAGPRNCIGQRFALMEEKTILANILRKFKVISLDPRDRIEIMAGLIMRNVDPIRIRFELRE